MKFETMINTEEKYTLVINYPTLSAGGIEVSLAALMRYSLSEGHRVIWITTTHCLQEIAFTGIADDPRLEIVISERWNRYFGVADIRFQESERVVMISCRAMSYIVAEEIKRRARVRSFQHFFTVAHFAGSAYYPDRYLKHKWVRSIVFHFWKKIVSRLVENDCLRAFSLKHLECYEDYYGVPIPDKPDKVIPAFDFAHREFDLPNAENRARERSRRFVITTCSRFTFPHKGYLLGLIDAFRIIKAKYPYAELWIIGHGEGETALREKIGMLPPDAQSGVKMVGLVSPDDLQGYYKQSNLIVGLAGAIWDGAMSGIPSLVVRHYCYDCETYGYFGDASNKVLSEEQGEGIVPYIEATINMEQEAYIDHARKGYAAACDCDESEENPNYFFEQRNAASAITVYRPWEPILGRILYVMFMIRDRFFRHAEA